MSTTISLDLPDDIACQLKVKWKDLSRAALERLAADAHQCDLISAEQLRRLLNLATRFEVEEFLKLRGVHDYTLEDFERDRETLRALEKTGARSARMIVVADTTPFNYLILIGQIQVLSQRFNRALIPEAC